MSVDKLFEVRNHFFIGNYQGCIGEAQKLNLRAGEEQELRDFYLYRAYLAQKKATLVLSEIPEKTQSASLKAVRRYAEYMNNGSPSSVSSQVESEAQSSTDDNAIVIYAAIYISAGNPEEALRILHTAECLEARATSVHALLSMDRVDLAVKELKKMCEVDEDATITQLTAAWVNMSVGKEKLKDAFYIYQEMIDKYGPTPYLLIGQSNTLIAQGRFEEADKVLQEVLNRNPNSVEAMINRMLVNSALGKARAAQSTRRQLVEIGDAEKTHPFVEDYERALSNLKDLA